MNLRKAFSKKFKFRLAPKNAVFLILAFLFVSLFLLEISLRLSGIMYNAMRTRSLITLHNKNNDNSGNFNILCLGDSYTYGLGASFEYSYPSQLGRMLNEKFTGKKINVENLGSPGGNSYRILNILTNNLQNHKPDLAIIMVGMNNDWNLEGIEQSYNITFLGKLKVNIYDLHTYKLFKILALNIRRKIDRFYGYKPYPYPSVKDKNPGLNNKIYQEPLPQDFIPQNEWENHKNMVELYRKSGRSDLATQEIIDMLKKYPRAYGLSEELVLFLREAGNFDLALEVANKALEIAPVDSKRNAYMHLELLYIYRAKQLWRLAREQMNYAVQNVSLIQSVFPELKHICGRQESGLDFNKEVPAIRELISKIHGRKGTDILDKLLYLEKNREKKLEIIGADLLRLINIARRNNIKLILMTYPISASANEIIRKVAQENNTDLVDNELIFNARPNKEGLFNLDSHCNAQGYELIATSAYPKVANIKNVVLTER